MSPLSPYGTQVELTTGETVTVATRERPKMWFNSKGQKTHLFNGVCSAPNCPNGPATGCVDCKCESRGMHCRFPASSPPSLLHPPPLGSCLPGYAYSPWPSCGRCELGLHARAAARRVGSATCCMGGYVCQFMCATMRAIHARLSQRRVCECAGGGQPPLGSANQAAPPAKRRAFGRGRWGGGSRSCRGAAARPRSGDDSYSGSSPSTYKLSHFICPRDYLEYGSIGYIYYTHLKSWLSRHGTARLCLTIRANNHDFDM